MNDTPMIPHYLGVDISKDRLDVHCRLWKSPRAFANGPRGIASLLAAVGKLGGPAHLVCEATGGYERALLEAALEAGVGVSLTNPRQVRDFAKASGALAKTDVIDAGILTRFGECFAPRPLAPKSPAQKALQACVRRRASLVALRKKEQEALARASDPYVRRDIASLVRVLGGRIAKIDKLIAQLVASDAAMKAKAARMEEVTGVGAVVSSTVLAELPELGKISDRQASSLVGLAPFNSDSGKHRGRRQTKGGRALMRRTLYMPALCAAHRNPVFKEIYRRLVARGKPHHVAIVAVMRKLVCLLNRILANPDFQLAK